MLFFRVLLIGATLIVFLGVAVPLQWIALYLRWPWRGMIPVAFCRILTRLLRVSVYTQGAPGPAPTRLLAANHISWIDILALYSVEPICFLAKREVGGWPLIGFFAKLQETVFVDRNRRRSIPAANAAMARRMLDGRAALLFPEGTTGDGLLLRKFHSSHFAAARDLLIAASGIDSVAVQPVAISYSSPAAAWLGEDSLLPHVWAVLKGEPIRCDLMFGEPLRYGRGTNRKIIAREAAVKIAAMRAAAGPAEGVLTPAPTAEMERLAAPSSIVPVAL
ncbi:1-acyl-sn-glycerol-3-phosphate acyltransferase [Methylocella tundrae]|uniref:1-acyl-sn-glycerol-3-phosphate acyltransferase n=1 Tax=Methylocella tundrae TaxID=227605 RepID=A0A8B6M5H0_METTU|nr:lysophospholipid acyltransferase family protein [Methylocella tundrae]VTZ27460.1 1-acyl-sn-glycerol-3-phosphate acyltransferase [Methylocella tundrae]VTZ50261.1 1-acyl-sn-glycerol-3-phosphate acyltransferase [Methylocella tundrae]